MEMTTLTWVLLVLSCLGITAALYFGVSYRKVFSEHLALKSEASKLQEESRNLSVQLATISAELDSEKRLAQERLAQFSESKIQMTEHFKNLAQDILEEKSQKFTAQNQQNLDILLKPLHERIDEFKKRVNDVYDNEARERFALQKEIQNLSSLNITMSKEAQALTKALKGDSKAQGNWGELVLERILEHSGLRKDFEYVIQDKQVNEHGQRQYPDVVINLPDSKHLVIDSKVSLTAFTRSVELDDELHRDKEIKEHIKSIRNHINELSNKKYQELYGLASIDFVMMFIPVEPAFLTAMSVDHELFQEALTKNIVLVCPSTLLATVRTVAHLWRQEHQNKNALEIARQCGALYDKFVNFTDDLTKVGDRLGLAQQSYDDAYKKLTTGNGNLVRSAQKVIELGVKSNKALSTKLLNEMESGNE